MQIAEAQKEMQEVYYHGSAGSLSAAIIWIISATVTSWINLKLGLLLLFIVGIFIFPLTKVIINIFGEKRVLSKENKLNQLAIQIAFTVPLMYGVILVVYSRAVEFYYPVFMIIVGAHYIPFVFLYGMNEFGILGGLLLIAGTFLIYFPMKIATGAWIAVVLFLGFTVYTMLRYNTNQNKN